MSCVNIKHKDFIALVDATGISASNLEVIVHEYQNTLGDYESFPTVEYVNSRLEKPNVVTSTSQVALWEQRYSASLIFKTKEALNAAIAEASNYYSREAITSWKNTKGEYVMRIGRPQIEDSVELTTSYNILRKESPKDALLRTLDKEGLIHRHNTGKDYVLTLNSEVKYGSQEDIDPSKNRETLISEAYQKVQNRLERLGFPADTITITPTKAGGTAIVVVNEGILSQIQDSVASGAKIEDIKAIHDLTDFLSRTFGIEFGGIISVKQANELTGNADPNAFIQNNKVYVVANRVSVDTIAEEFLHPFVNTLYKEEPETFNSLFEEASKLFPELKTRILSSYRGRKNLKFTSEDLKQELVAQALSRHFREEWEKSLKENRANTEETLKSLDAAEKFFTKAWKAIQRLLKTIEEKLYGKSVRLESSDLRGMSLRQIAQLVNASDSSFWVDRNDKIRFSLGKATGKFGEDVEVIDVAEQTPTSEGTNEAFAKESQSLTSQIDNLLNSNIISATEVRHIAEQVVYWISDHITEIQENPELLTTIYGDGLANFDVTDASRLEIVNAIGISNILAFCREKFSPTEGKYNNRKTIRKARLIVDNWKAITTLAADVFINVENFSVIGESVTEEFNVDADNFNNSNDHDSIAEIEGDTQEHWQVENRTLDILNSMSQIVKQALTKCYVLKETIEDGQVSYSKVTSEFGINERINARDATNSILRWTQGALTLEDMVTKLKAKVSNNPWIIQVIDRLSDTSGKEADFQSQFFSTFFKPFQSYSVVIKDEETGKYKSIQVNEHPALTDAVNSIVVQYKIGEHPMFTYQGVNKDTFKEFKSAYEDLLALEGKLNDDNKQEIARNIAFVANTLGYYITPDIVLPALNKETFNKMLSNIGHMVKHIGDNLDNKNYDPFKFKASGSIRGNIRGFLQPLTDHLEDTAVSSFYDSGKMYQSYTTPSYMTKLMLKFNLKDKEFDDFILSEYGAYEWFRFKGARKIDKGWRNVWLEKLVKDGNAREVFKHKVQLNFNKHNYMRNMSDTEYTLSLITEYFSETTSEKQSRVPAWFRVPMLSNKPSSEFIRFYSERGINYKDDITKGLKQVFDQELSRIQTVEMRAFKPGDPEYIKNLDKNGRKFCFLDFMNVYLTGDLKDSELGKLINAKIKGQDLTSEQENTLSTLAKKVIYDTMDARAKAIVDDWTAKGIVEGAKQITDVGTEDAEVRENLINFVWNDTFAAINILQLTITDTAYYKDAEDLQKRLAQIHAPGIRGNVAATDYNGNPVTDGKERTFYLTDFDDFKSNIIENLTIVFDRKIANAKTEQEKSGLEALKEYLLRAPEYDDTGKLINPGGEFYKINVADAQGFSSPTSYRKKAFIFGRWSTKAEDVYQRLKSNDFTYADLKTAFQPLKPFVYSQIEKPSNVKGAPLNTLKVPVQNKNSEYLLVLADAILQNEDTGRPNLLRAVYEIMEESAKDDNTRGIDTVQFESTVKSGLMGAVNIKQFQYAEDGKNKAKAAMRAAIYANGVSGEYNNSVVHEIPFEDYCLQQEVPPHFKNHEQAHGSQIRYIIPSDLEDVDYLGNKVTYEVEGRQLSADEFKAEYERTIADNIQHSINTLIEELHLSGTPKEKNLAISKILQREILSSPRYGVDLLQACSVDEDGNFRIPLGDPIQSKRVEQLINSIIKNRVNKQTIPGGPVVQVSNFGTSKELNIRFYSKETDENGNKILLKTRKEFEGSDEAYKEYIKENQAGIAYFEVFAPIYSNEIFTKFQRIDGSIDIEAIEAVDPDLLKMIGYRIPTEDKYSMAPLKIVGFLPREAGEGIMMPNDITLLTGSDFDVDKMYLMRKEVPLKTRPKRDIEKLMFDKIISSKEGAKFTDKQELAEKLEMFFDNPEYMKTVDPLYNYMWELYKRVAYVADPPTEGKAYRDNKIIDMTYAVLSHESTADKILNPGGFEPQKRMGYLIAAFKNPANKGKYTWNELTAMTTNRLKELSYVDKNLSFIDTHIQFYNQNSAAGVLIGLFAVHKVAHAVLESNGYMVDVDNACFLNEPFVVADMEFGGNMVLDAKYDKNGQLIGKSLGSLVASSVDAVKDPVLNLMNINGTTARYLTALERLGMPFEDAALFLSQSVITDVIYNHNKNNITKYSTFEEAVDTEINRIYDLLNMSIDPAMDSYNIANEPLTREELIAGLKDDASEKTRLKVLLALKKVQRISEAIKGPTFATRFNSISSAVGPLIIDNLIIEHKMQQFSDNILGPDGNPVGMDDILRRHPILEQFSRTVGMAKFIFQGMPANSNGFRQILDSMPDSMADIIYGDRKLLSTLSDFYQSYLMLASGAIKEEQLTNYISGFPTWFFKQGFKDKYTDNALIQSIKLDVNKDTGRATLKVDTVGLDTQQKEILSNAWIDLYNDNPDLAIRLFIYNFFKSGIGFSPKSFMGLIPTYIKERIPGYLETYRKLPSVSPLVVLDQFVRNNWDNRKLVPTIKDLKYTIKDGTLRIYGEDQVKSMAKIQYFRLPSKGTYTLWRQENKTDTAISYVEVSPLGNNGEYLEMSTSQIKKAKEIPAVAKDQLLDDSITDTANQLIDGADSKNELSATQDETLELLYRVLETAKGVSTREEAVAKAQKYKGKTKEEKAALESSMKKFFKKGFEKLGLKFNDEKIDEIYKKMC